jgi:CRP-like cAMP-binding protein
VYNSPDVSKKFIKMLSNELAAKEEQLLQLAYNSVRKRVAEALLTLYNKYGQQENQGNFSMKISREDLSNLVGTSTETVIRTLSDFKDEGLVDLKGGLITILKSDKLVAMKN